MASAAPELATHGSQQFPPLPWRRRRSLGGPAPTCVLDSGATLRGTRQLEVRRGARHVVAPRQPEARYFVGLSPSAADWGLMRRHAIRKKCSGARKIAQRCLESRLIALYSAPHFRTGAACSNDDPKHTRRRRRTRWSGSERRRRGRRVSLLVLHRRRHRLNHQYWLVGSITLERSRSPCTKSWRALGRASSSTAS